jgi:hypothetical protein
MGLLITFQFTFYRYFVPMGQSRQGLNPGRIKKATTHVIRSRRDVINQGSDRFLFNFTGQQGFLIRFITLPDIFQ